MPSVESLGSFVNDTVIYQCLKNPIAQVSEEWWPGGTMIRMLVNAKFRLIIAKCIKIHMSNILKCVDKPLLTNASALNEVKKLDYITRDLTLPHHNQTNFANEINLKHWKLLQAIKMDVNMDVDMDVDIFMDVDMEDLAEDIEVTHIQFSMYFMM
ncbi:unnamed protein product [Rhizophagus irregularis]|nr:unnamed protein product [Rhizophagus irregularis]